MKRFNVINYNINRESIIDLPDIHHSLIIIPETLYENSELASIISDNKSTTAASTYKIEEEEEEEVETKVNDEEEVNEKVINNTTNTTDEKSKNFTDIDLSEIKQKNSFSSVRQSLTIDASSLPVITPSHVNNSERSIKSKKKFFSCTRNKVKLLAIFLIIIVLVIVITVVLV